MSEYSIWVVDPFQKAPTVAVAEMLREWFDPIARKAKFSRASVYFPQYIVQPQVHELLIYICPFTTSVVQKMTGANKDQWPDPVLSRHSGVTILGQLTGSEVWAKFSEADAFASLIFHECMHNKLQLGKSLHGKFPPARLSAENITWPTSPSPSEASAMAAALRNPVPQWTEGQRPLWYAAKLFAEEVPLWEQDISA